MLEDDPPVGYGLTSFETHWIDAWDEFVQILRSRDETLPGFPVWAESWRDFREVATLHFPSLAHADTLKPLESVRDGFVPPRP